MFFFFYLCKVALLPVAAVLDIPPSPMYVVLACCTEIKKILWSTKYIDWLIVLACVCVCDIQCQNYLHLFNVSNVYFYCKIIAIIIIIE